MDDTTNEALTNAKFYQKTNITYEPSSSMPSDGGNDRHDSKRVNIENGEASYFKLMKDNTPYRLFILSYFATMSGE